jgi:predicted aldo/keto reductase-like oxidoreductase
MKRRSFLAGVGGAISTGALTGTAKTLGTLEADQQIERRALGKTGRTLPVVGFPGLALAHCEEAAGRDAMHRAIDHGIDYLDVAPAYGKDGECEIKMGAGLQGIGRDKYFLACKTQKDDAKGARLELERSLKRLKTDHFDLYQLHCLQRVDEVEEALGPGGVLETILKAKEEGKVRHIGFSAHTTESALAALDGFDFDTCMFPLNFVEYFKTGFGRAVLDKTAQKGVAVISIKPVSLGRWPEGAKRTRDWWYRTLEDDEHYRLAMGWTLAQRGVVSTVPTSFLDVFDRTVAAAFAARDPRPADAAVLKEIAANCIPLFKAGEQDLSLCLPPGLPAYPSRPRRLA